jgi:hypothetical protein
VRPIPLLKYSSGRVLYYKKTLLKLVIHTSGIPLVRINLENTVMQKFGINPEVVV